MRQLDQQIDLYQHFAKRKANAFSSSSSPKLLAAGMAGMMLIQLYGYYHLKSEESRHDSMMQQVERLQKQVANMGGKRKENQLLKERLLNLSNQVKNNEHTFNRLQSMLQEQPVFVSNYLEGLGTATPQGVWLTGIVADEAGGIELRGNAMNPALVPMLIQSLASASASASAFRGLTFNRVEVTKEENHISFHISTGGMGKDSS